MSNIPKKILKHEKTILPVRLITYIHITKHKLAVNNKNNKTHSQNNNEKNSSLNHFNNGINQQSITFN